MPSTSPKIAIVMGSKSDWATMQEATQILDQLHVSYHVEIVSAHRTPCWITLIHAFKNT